MRTGYLAKEGQEQELEKELQGVVGRFDRLFIAKGPRKTPTGRKMCGSTLKRSLSLRSPSRE